MGKDKKLFRDEVPAEERKNKTGGGRGGRKSAPVKLLVEFVESSGLWRKDRGCGEWATVIADENGLAQPSHVSATTYLFTVPADEDEYWLRFFRVLPFVRSAVRAPARRPKK